MAASEHERGGRESFDTDDFLDIGMESSFSDEPRMGSQGAHHSSAADELVEDVVASSEARLFDDDVPLLNEVVEKSLEKVIPDMIVRVKSALLKMIYRQFETIVSEQLPSMVDRIVTREMEKFR